MDTGHYRMSIFESGYFVGMRVRAPQLTERAASLPLLTKLRRITHTLREHAFPSGIRLSQPWQTPYAVP
jgi:hypothetical protein